MPIDGPVHIIDDDDAVRDSVSFLFDSAGLTVQAYTSAGAFLAQVNGGLTGCVVTDVRMPDMSGLELLRELRARGLAVPVIVITGHGDVPLAVEAMKAGASDFLEKPFNDERLLAATRRVLEQAGPGQPDPERIAIRSRVNALSQRERQVLKGLVDGQLNKTIAWELGISARTVEVYRAKLMSKMEAPAFADLIRMALACEDMLG